MIEQTISEDFKQAMRRLASTVAIITSGNAEHPAGMAATAVMSAAGDPPTIVVAVNRNASLSPVLAEHGRFCVNLLAERHCDLVGVFSGAVKGAERFDAGDWTSSQDGLPVLSDAAASMICTTMDTLEVATHTLFVGRVDSIVNHPAIDPLVWVDGRMASAQPIPTA
ncbi:flavin reductase family protein [Sphingobium sp. AN558]|uniref:flavin reductase family protein n=1 Tax=Sphingobium sp. AN558 TaxID=3133442 RepID=UPI0030C59960